MSAAWLTVIAVGAVTIAFKASGPVLLGRRPLPPRALALVEVLAPVMLSALVVTQAFGGDRRLVFDERLVGVGVALVAISLRAPLIVVIAVAGGATALTRLLL